MKGQTVRLSESLPGPVQPVVKRAHYSAGWDVATRTGVFSGVSEADLVERFFESEAELRRYEAEFDDGPAGPRGHTQPSARWWRR